MPGQVRSIAVRFLAEVGNYVQGVGRMKAATGDLVTELSKSEQARQNFQRLGTTMLVAGAGIAAGIGLATRAAVQWESAWAGVAKTVDGTDAELAALEEDLRGLARELPATHGEIAAVAEAAGQLGVATEDITEFTRVMIGLGEATNLTADEAATSIAQLMNVMGTAPDEVDNLASALVELGNNGASTEKDIVMMAQRIAGAGSIVGATEADVLALANALSSAGIEVEAGGSAISRVMVDVATAVNDGGEKLDMFAQVAGKSSNQFATAWRQDPVAALNLFIQGLGRMNAAGGDVFGTLEALSLSEVRTRDALLRLSSAGDLLTASLDDGARAWDENTALLHEVERRYGTVEARLQIARNQINDFAIDMGQVFLPVLGAVADKAGAFVEVLAELPGPMKTAVGILAALAAGALLLGGALFAVIPRIAATKAALDQLAASGGRAAVASRALQTSIGFLAGPWGAAIAAAVTVATVAFAAWGMEQAESKQRTQEVADTLDDMTGAFTDATRALVAHELEERGALEAADRLGLSLSELTDIIMSGEDAQRRLQEAISESTDGMIQFAEDGSIAKGATSDLAVDMIALMEAQHDLTPELAAGVEQWQRTNEATGEAATRMQELDPATRDLADAFGGTMNAAEGVADAVDDLDKELEQLFDRVFGLSNAQDELAEQFMELTEQVQQQHDANVEGAGSLEGFTQAAIDNRTAAQELMELYGQLALETIKQTGSAEEAAAVAADFEDQLALLEEQTGLNIREMEGYNEVVDEIDRLIRVTFNTSGVQRARDEAAALKLALDNIDRHVSIMFSVHGPGTLPRGLQVAQRWGGIVKAQTGKLIPAHITRSPTVMYGERATGMEAYIPMYGSRSRSLAIADTAARWHGGRVVPAGMADATREPLASIGNQWRGRPTTGDSSGGRGAGGGTFTGNLYVGWEFIGKVEGMIDRQMDNFGNSLLRGMGQGVGGAR